MNVPLPEVFTLSFGGPERHSTDFIAPGPGKLVYTGGCPVTALHVTTVHSANTNGTPTPTYSNGCHTTHTGAIDTQSSAVRRAHEHNQRIAGRNCFKLKLKGTRAELDHVRRIEAHRESIELHTPIEARRGLYSAKNVKYRASTSPPKNLISPVDFLLAHFPRRRVVAVETRGVPYTTPDDLPPGVLHQEGRIQVKKGFAVEVEEWI
ncbi:hypothetical protein DFH09DRAFT_1078604 [Mycena vulgaris]|nr:hypothetical protein DFH09DRAFT_1078604 [Mycena vulgaris]